MLGGDWRLFSQLNSVAVWLIGLYLLISHCKSRSPFCARAHLTFMARFRLRRYRFSIEDTTTLQKILSIRISRWRLVLSLVGGAVVCVGIGALIVALTPVKRSVPGFMTGSDRDATLAAIMRIDSLSDALRTNQIYFDNLSSLLDDNRLPADSLEAGVKLAPLPLESIRQASSREQQFVATIDDRERFNLNVLSPLAAESVILADPAEGGIIAAESAHSRLLKLILPDGHGVNAMMDGRVIERNYDAADASYSILIQGRRGFLVRYSHINTPLVDTGDAVTAGQRLSVQDGARRTHTRYVGIEMWREGTPLTPGDYLRKPSRELPEPIEAPRGK